MPFVVQKKEPDERGRVWAIVNADTGEEKGRSLTKKDAEGLTKRQRLWMETVTDFRNTIYECARVAGYSNPEQAVRQLYDNPCVLRAILRRYHRRMLQMARVFGPQMKFVKTIPKPQWRSGGVHVRSGQGNAQEGMRVPVAEGVQVDSLLGEGK